MLSRSIIEDSRSINDTSTVARKLSHKSQVGASLTDDSGVIIYDRNMFIIQATRGSMGLRYVLKL